MLVQSIACVSDTVEHLEHGWLFGGTASPHPPLNETACTQTGSGIVTLVHKGMYYIPARVHRQDPTYPTWPKGQESSGSYILAALINTASPPAMLGSVNW